jgi:very-short-patch-repair endonuclease
MNKIKRFVFNTPNLKIRRRNLRKSSTDAERKLWSKLRDKQLLNLKFFRQYSVGPYILDFYCPTKRLAIELDGSQHATTDKRFYDEKRSLYLKKFNLQVLRFWDNDVLKNTDGVLLKILEHLTPPNLPLI